MRSFARFAFATLVAASLAQADGEGCPPGPRPCPTVTTTAELCGTCIVKECLALSTIINPPECPDQIATFTTSYPCEDGTCPDGCASTSYIYGSTFTDSGSYPTPTATEVVCPTVYTTAAACGTCILPACLSLSTIKSECGCPTAVPTVTIEYDCADPCPTGCADTSYIYDTAIPNCPTEPPVSNTCVPTVTITSHPGTFDGCAYECSNEFCITDKFVTLPCGCTSADSVVTETEVVCAEQSRCWNCHTGFPFTTTADDCPYS